MTYMVEVDEQGRIQLPDSVRESLHLAAGSQLALEQGDDAPENITLSTGTPALIWEDGLLVAAGGSPMSAQDTLALIDLDRRERLAHVSGGMFTAEDFR